jgi:hypothetical protein
LGVPSGKARDSGGAVASRDDSHDSKCKTSTHDFHGEGYGVLEILDQKSAGDRSIMPWGEPHHRANFSPKE